jgi:signal peptidase II
MKFLLSVALPLYVLDQATKWATLAAAMRGDLPHTVIGPDIFQLVYWQNTGAAFSIGDGNNWFFVVLSIVAFIGLLIAWSRGIFADKPSRWGVALLLSGILGNVTDRILHGHVVDMLLFDFGFRPFHPWPAFNIADSCICTAVGLFLIGSFRSEKK